MSELRHTLILLANKVGDEIAQAERRLALLRERKKAIDDWLADDIHQTAFVTGVEFVPAGREPEPETDKPAPAVSLGDALGDAVSLARVDNAPPRGPLAFAPPRVHTVATPADNASEDVLDELDARGSGGESTNGQIIRILRASPKPLTCNEIFERGAFRDAIAVAGQLSHMTLRKGWLDRESITVPGHRKNTVKEVFAYSVKADAQIPESV